jgi:ABC-type phosphate transport system substrate-binding protein
MKLTLTKAVPILALCGFATFAAAEDIVVIVNPKNSTTALTADEVEGIFLGKTSTLPGGGTPAPADQTYGSPLRDAFYQKATSKDAAQVKAVWSRIVFSGKGTPPKTLGSSADVKKFVASDPNGIGYIEKSAADSSVKIVLTLP